MRVLNRRLSYPAYFFCLAFLLTISLSSRAWLVNAVHESAPSQATINIPVGAKPQYISAGDINSDMYPDILAGALQNGSRYSFILNNGAGGFLPAITNAGTREAFHQLKDFNNDGKLDFFNINVPSSIMQPYTVRVRLGDGTGGFGATISSPLTLGGNVNLADVAIADFNNDNKLDVAASHSGPGAIVPAGGMAVVLGDGAGGFTAGSYSSLRPRGSSIAAGDFNQDGKQDIAALSNGGSCGPECTAAVQILFGDGTGNFPTRNNLTQVEQLIYSIAAGDFNNDGKLDLVGIKFVAGGPLTTLLNTGAGDFVLGGSPNNLSTGGSKVRVGDFNNDGKLDAAYSSSSTHLAYIVYGNGLGGFTNYISLGVGITPLNLDVADFNRNGQLDLAVANYDSNDVTVILDPTVSTPRRDIQFDFDGDFRVDIAVYREGNTPNAPSYWYILQSSDSTYQSIQLGAHGDLPVPADYNGDGKADVAVWRPSTGTWYTSTNQAINYGAFHWGQQGDIPLPGDFDGDGRPDYCVYRPANGNWYVLRSSDGGFQQQQFGTASDRPLLGDFDGDGRNDFAFYRPGATALANSFWNVIQSSNGAFLSVQFGRGEDRPVPADYDGDGKTNFAVYRPSTSVWYTSTDPVINYGAVLFGAEGDVPVPGNYDLSSFETDGKADLAVFRPGSGVWYVRRSTDGEVVGRQWGVPSDRPVPSSFSP